MPLSDQKRQQLAEQKRQIEQQLETDAKERLIHAMRPMSQADFNQSMTKFAKYTLQSYYEPWEFSSEDLADIRRDAIRAGLRPDSYSKDNRDLKELVEAADIALERAKRS